ncbi:MAG TPA: 2OG-Fe(II) oxygenase [Rudaea sp.]
MDAQGAQIARESGGLIVYPIVARDNAFMLRSYLRTALRWQKGRQQSGYDKMLLLQSLWPLPFDVYILRFPQGSEIAPHTDAVSSGRHYRLNIVIKRATTGGEFVCATPIYASSRIKLFRPDACEHSVTRVVRGSRYVLSIGWIRRGGTG